MFINFINYDKTDFVFYNDYYEFIRISLDNTNIYLSDYIGNTYIINDNFFNKSDIYSYIDYDNEIYFNHYKFAKYNKIINIIIYNILYDLYNFKKVTWISPDNYYIHISKEQLYFNNKLVENYIYDHKNKNTVIQKEENNELYNLTEKIKKINIIDDNDNTELYKLTEKIKQINIDDNYNTKLTQKVKKINITDKVHKTNNYKFKKIDITPETRCIYIFKRGKNKDKCCNKKIIKNKQFMYCSQHVKYYTLPQV